MKISVQFTLLSITAKNVLAILVPGVLCNGITGFRLGLDDDVTGRHLRLEPLERLVQEPDDALDAVATTKEASGTDEFVLDLKSSIKCWKGLKVH